MQKRRPLTDSYKIHSCKGLHLLRYQHIAHLAMRNTYRPHKIQQRYGVHLPLHGRVQSQCLAPIPQ
jgi:hypothetical protein